MPYTGPSTPEKREEGESLECRMLLSKRLFAETFGTFALVFAGTGAVIINQVSGGAITHPGIALTFGLIILAMIYALGDVSGAHFNPAVTTAFAAAGRFPWREVPAYIGAQLIGAFLASLTLRVLFPTNEFLGSTLPAGSEFQSFVLEAILTLFLMVVILHVSTGAKEKGITAGIAIGAVIGLEAMFAGPICGASMNPARSIAPAVVSGHVEHLWIYLAGPLLGALVAVPACCLMQEPGCCGTKSSIESQTPVNP
jgi:aquaporin Z